MDIQEQLVEGLRALNQNMGRAARASEAGGNGRPIQWHSHAQKVAESLKYLNKSTQDAHGQMMELSRGIVSSLSSKGWLKLAGIGMGLKELLDSFRNLTGTYQKLQDVGQGFGGSMLKMQIAAAEAQLPLEEFAEALKKNSVAIASVGTRSFFTLNKELRKNLEQFGMFGMSLTEVTDMLAEYVETERVWGIANTRSKESEISSMTALAGETTALAQITGKSRQETLKQMNQMLRDTQLRARQMDRNARLNDDQQDNLKTAMAFLSGQAGEAGEILPRMLAQTVGTGWSAFADDMQTFVDAGLLGALPAFDGLRSAIERGEDGTEAAMEMNNQLVREGQANIGSLRMQAMGGNQAAKQVLNMLSNMKIITQEQMEQARKDTQLKTAFTKFFGNLEQYWSKITGLIREKVFVAFEHLLDKIEEVTGNHGLDAMWGAIDNAVTSFANWLEGISNDDIRQGIDDLVNLPSTIKSWAISTWNWIKSTYEYMEMKLKEWATSVDKFIPKIEGWVKDIGGFMQKIEATADTLTLLAEAALVAYGVFKAFSLLNALGGGPGGGGAGGAGGGARGLAGAAGLIGRGAAFGYLGYEAVTEGRGQLAAAEEEARKQATAKGITNENTIKKMAEEQWNKDTEDRAAKSSKWLNENLGINWLSRKLGVKLTGDADLTAPGEVMGPPMPPQQPAADDPSKQSMADWMRPREGETSLEDWIARPENRGAWSAAGVQNVYDRWRETAGGRAYEQRTGHPEAFMPKPDAMPAVNPDNLKPGATERDVEQEKLRLMNEHLIELRKANGLNFSLFRQGEDERRRDDSWRRDELMLYNTD